MASHGGAKAECPFANKLSAQETDDRSLRDRIKARDSASDFRNFTSHEGTTLSQFNWGVRADTRSYDMSRPKTRALMAKLAARMQVPVPEDQENTQFNDAVPAGYTYLGQLISHDMVMSEGSLATGNITAHKLRDFRAKRLMLDTLYGGGPDIDPMPYTVQPHVDDGRPFLRLSSVKFARADRPDLWPKRDVPRAVITGLNDNWHEGYDPNARDVLIADARNDDNLLISQLLVMFHHAHNLIVGQIMDLARAGEVDLPRRDALRNGGPAFRLARQMMTRLWRRIIVGDYLSRVLDPEIHKTYGGADPDAWKCRIDTPDDHRMPVEFSHGVFRFGHAMVRDHYTINENAGAEFDPGTGQMEPIAQTGDLRQMLHLTSDNTFDVVPFNMNWAVQWGQFFAFDATTYPGDGAPPKPQPSRLMLPSIVPALMPLIGTTDAFGGAGLPYRDLVASVEVGTRSARSLSEQIYQHFGWDLPDGKHGLEAEIGTWLDAPDTGVSFTEDDKKVLTEDPPLPFFFLFEASQASCGRHLGKVGSTIVAETVAAALSSTGDILADEDTSKAWEAHLGLAEMHRMDQLIALVAKNYTLSTYYDATETPLV